MKPSNCFNAQDKNSIDQFMPGRLNSTQGLHFLPPFFVRRMSSLVSTCRKKEMRQPPLKFMYQELSSQNASRIHGREQLGGSQHLLRFTLLSHTSHQPSLNAKSAMQRCVGHTNRAEPFLAMGELSECLGPPSHQGALKHPGAPKAAFSASSEEN